MKQNDMDVHMDFPAAYMLRVKKCGQELYLHCHQDAGLMPAHAPHVMHLILSLYNQLPVIVHLLATSM